ncbi:MAG TPA: DUF2721 domain-containing protein, partial [Steroidobacteraceae bacterium]|nr:DUF2721 domain-containing protein [Steroidobacteraceae bacterium]
MPGHSSLTIHTHIYIGVGLDRDQAVQPALSELFADGSSGIVRTGTHGARAMMSLTTPALLFPAISLLLLAYTNRFLTLATIIRQLHPGEGKVPTELARKQIAGLRYRVSLIRHMQTCGVVSFLLCAVSMFAIFIEADTAGQILFGLSL